MWFDEWIAMWRDIGEFYADMILERYKRAA